MPETIFSSVLLPDPFRPMRPRLSPRRSSKLTDLEHAKPLLRTRPEEIERVLAHRVPPDAGMVKLFDTPADFDDSRPHHSSSATRGDARAIDQRAAPRITTRLREQQHMRER